jgi:hypothetical protein
MKDTIFISHSAPENDYFATWIAAKLKLIGCNVWVDTKDLRGGDSFWPEVENIIRKEAIRFIAIVSKDYIRKASVSKSGVRKEISCASTIRDIENFIIPIRYDNSSYGDLPIDIIDLHVIDFCDKWGLGLTELLEDLDSSGIPRNNKDQNILKFWYESRRLSKEVIERKESYYTNWFTLNLPEKIYFYQFKDFDENNFKFAFRKEGKKIITFATEEATSLDSSFGSSINLDTPQLFTTHNLTIDGNLMLSEPNKKLIEIINGILRKYLIMRQLRVYNLSGKKEVFHFPYTQDNKRLINLKRYGKTRKSIMGEYEGNIWHYGISFAAGLFPLPHIKVSSHLLFSKKTGWYLNKKEQHSLRRSMASEWYNRHWLELMLAFFLRLAEDRDYIDLSSVAGQGIELDSSPISLNSGFGYEEPKSAE